MYSIQVGRQDQCLKLQASCVQKASCFCTSASCIFIWASCINADIHTTYRQATQKFSLIAGQPRACPKWASCNFQKFQALRQVGQLSMCTAKSVTMYLNCASVQLPIHTQLQLHLSLQICGCELHMWVVQVKFKLYVT